ncbi:hypothetical protein PHYSODRAFT_335447 [Phytophthora sojae]|uniref:Uncharacterized protein n=1 Tax=Phytophthora sojae (strain P6497) TaxID=1094619 RepID=G4ZV77_PHYSP|nr:hypothetical protein PHYSODRAFT_335447 [Phytophthora sojae]EGZ13701.1 hypothetical protein PHYSODRAFT_335447 [Phytophthora sojae]|eukprot:XP_009531130.1 hypothetical protein PHYSODRAFT_335447 [Phytophthora sojae]
MSSPQKKTDAAAEGKSSAGIETLSIPESQSKADAVDDEDDDVEVEEGEASSSKRKESIDSDRDDSDASSSKRSRGESDTPLSAAGALSSPREVVPSSCTRAAQAARDPWTPSASEIADHVGMSPAFYTGHRARVSHNSSGSLSGHLRVTSGSIASQSFNPHYDMGNTVPPNEIPLYVCSGIYDDAVAEEQHLDPLTNQRRDYYIGLFHKLRYFSSKKTSSRSKVPEWQALYILDARAAGAAPQILCGRWYSMRCTLCLPGAARLSDRDLNGYTTIRVTASLKDRRAKFLAREERDDRGTSGAVGDRSARTTFASAVRGELRTPSPIPERPAAGRPVAPMYLGGAETLSNEYDKEPAAGSFSGYYGSQYAQQSSVSSRGRRGSEAAVVGTRPGYGQPGVDLGPTLEERVAAVEQHQSREFAALKQEVAILRAQVAQASQTASDISVDVGGRVARLPQRLHALKQRFAPAGASASGQPS